MAYKEFVKQHDVDYSKNLVEERDLEQFEKIIGLNFGTQLRDYILTYGYLGYLSIEFYGVNSRQKEKSDLITQTLYLHKYFEKTKCYIAFENMGEGRYVLVDENDKVYYYYSEQDEIQSLDLDLEKYMLTRFNSK